MGDGNVSLLIVYFPYGLYFEIVAMGNVDNVKGLLLFLYHLVYVVEQRLARPITFVTFQPIKGFFFSFFVVKSDIVNSLDLKIIELILFFDWPEPLWSENIVKKS